MTDEPAASNIQVMKDTFIKLANDLADKGELKHTYDFYFYYGNHSAQQTLDTNNTDDSCAVIPIEGLSNCYRIQTLLQESIYNTFEKGIIALKEIDGYDWYIRINISCFINIKALDKILIGLDKDTVYCNAINSYINDETYFNDLYPRGDFMMFSKKVRQGILDNYKKYWRCDIKLKDRINIPHVDDCLFGLCLIDYFGKNYYKHLQMLKYNFIPDAKAVLPENLDKLAIASRVKTIPPGIGYSGYSWEDNVYRRIDGEKMKLLNDMVEKLDLNKQIVGVASQFDNSRPTLAIMSQPLKVTDIHTILKNKRG